ncbi:MAG TPA: dephospho-CoA kinase [Thermoleophilia bacterium]|nr:dephospho-CoA kinase [Thermoleophilia bacterium]
MTTHRIPRLGVTGGIGSGKSTATAFLTELGAAVVSADELVHHLLEEQAIISRVERHFGGGVLEAEQIDRPALAQVVFNDAGELVWLESLLHPHVKRLIDAWAKEQERRRPRPPLLVAEVPLLFETDMADVFDYILLVTAPEATRRRRLSAKVTSEEFSRRAARQQPESDKAARCDFVVENVGAREGLRRYVGEVYATILAETGRSGASPPTR